MIVNYTEEGWQIITQRAHGLLAGQLAFNWKEEDRPERWLETIIAIVEHDDATLELEDNDLITDKGGPVNFKMKSFEKDHCEKLMRLALTKSKYIAVLTARHIRFIYGQFQEQEAVDFREELIRSEVEWLKELHMTSEEITKNYRLLEWCDAFSLLICQKLIQPESRKMEISLGPDDKVHRFYETAPGKLTVEPWPFQSDSFIVEFESKTVPQLTFANDEEFRQLYMKAATTFNRYELTRKPQ